MVVSFSVMGLGSSLAFLNLIVVPETDASRRSREINFTRTFRSCSEYFELGLRGFVNSSAKRSRVNIRPTLFGRCAICCSIFSAESWTHPFVSLSVYISYLGCAFYTPQRFSKSQMLLSSTSRQSPLLSSTPPSQVPNSVFPKDLSRPCDTHSRSVLRRYLAV